MAPSPKTKPQAPGAPSPKGCDMASHGPGPGGRTDDGPMLFKCPHCGADDVGEAHPDRCGICGAVGTDAAMINSLKDWVARGIDEDREFTIRYLGGIKFPWNVRLEDEHQSWSHDEETHKTLGAAIVAALRAAKEELP